MTREQSSAENSSTHEKQPLIPISWVSRADMIAVDEDYVERVKALSDDEIAYIADKFSDALQVMYWDVLRFVLWEYFETSE